MSKLHPSLGEFLLPVQSANPADIFGGDDFSYIDIAAVDREERTISNPQVVAVADAPSRARQLIQAGDILVSTVRPNLNTVAMVGSDFDGAIASTGFCVLRVDTDLLDSGYLFHWIASEKVVRHLSAVATGASYPAVSDKIIKSLPIALPALKEQKRIAAILDKADSLRRKRQQAISLADDFLRTVFIDMFGDPVRKVGGRVSLAEVIDIDAPMVDPRLDEYADMLHVGPDRIEKYTGRLLDCQTAREEGLISKKFLFDDSYVLYSKIRPYLRKCALATFTGLCSADMYPVRPKIGIATREFIWALLLSNEFDRYVASLPDRANIPKLNRDELNAFEFNLPSIQEQEKFSAIVQKRVSCINLLDDSCSGTLKLASALQSQFF